MNNNISDISKTPMNDCRYTTIDIALYLLDKMTPEAHTQFEHHLTTCESCRTALKKIDNVARYVDEDEKKSPVQTKYLVYRSKVFLLSSAAMIVVLLTTTYFLNNIPRVSEKETVRQGIAPEQYLHTDTVHSECDTLSLR